MKAWFDDPKQLFDADQVTQFWPTGEQTPEDRVNAASRFIIYVCTILYVIRRDPRVFILGLTVLGVVYVLYKSRMVKENYGGSVEGVSCQMPTPNNPMGNVLITDYTDAPNRLEACYYPTVKPFVQAYSSDRIPYDAGRSRTAMPKDRKSTRLNSSHGYISYAVFCLKKKKHKKAVTKMRTEVTRRSIVK